MRNILYFIVIALVASSSTWGIGYGITYLDTPYQSQGVVDSINAIPPLPAELKLVTDTLANDTVGRITAHQVGFQLPPYTFNSGGLLRGRQAVVTFPTEFGLRTIDSVTYRDTDSLLPDPQITWVFVYSQSVVVRFSEDVPGPNGPYFIYLTFHSVTNATTATDHHVSVKIDNTFGQTVAGPALSESFALRAELPAGLTISPTEDLTLTAGDQVLFETYLFDQYGNQAGGGPAALGLDPNLDSIGVLYGHYLFARQSGAGRVVAQYGELTASSGLITVVPGPAAIFGVTLDATQFVGHPFLGSPTVTVYDQFHNIKTDFSSLEDAVAVAVDRGDITPDTIGAGQFVDGVASLAGYRYSGGPGPVTITLEAAGNEGPITGQAPFYANGIILGMPELPHIPATIPQNWHFRFQGTATNPGNLAPTHISYLAGFVESDSLQGLYSWPSNCLPQPGDPDGCSFMPKPSPVAWPAPGTHTFIIESRSWYAINGDSVEVIDTLEQAVEITPFTPPATIASDLPDTVIQGDFETPGSVTFGNISSFPYAAGLTGYLAIIGDTLSILAAKWQGAFDWSPENINSFSMRIDSLTPPGNYHYQVRYALVVDDAQAGLLGYESAPETLSAGLVIVARASYAVSPQSVTPNRVTVGTQVPFAFDLLLDGITTTVLDDGLCLLTLTDGTVSSSAVLAGEATVLSPGPNRVTAQPMTIPASWVGKEISGRLHLIGLEAGRALDTELVFPFPIVVEALPGLQVLSFDLDVPNPPYVNAGQTFTMTGHIVNHSATEAIGSVRARITSDGRTIPINNSIDVILTNIPPKDTVVLTVPITADTLPNPAEVFTLAIEPSALFTIVPSIDNQAAIVIQTPAAVVLTPGSVSIPNAVAYLDYGEPFAVKVQFEPADLARVTGGALALGYDGPGDFGVVFPVEKALDTAVIWSLTAPEQDINSAFTISWAEIPLDRNTGQPIPGLGGPIVFPFAVRASITRLVIDVQTLVTAPLQRGVTTPLFRMDIQNVTNDTRNSVRLKSVTLTATDRDGRQIDAGALIADSGSAFYDAGGAAVTTLNFSGGRAAFRFTDLVIRPGQATELEFRLTLRPEAAVDYFGIQMSGDDFSAEISEGPRAGEPAPVYGLLDKPFSISLPQAIIAENLGESFKNYPNPFNPDIEQTEIRYYLPAASDVEIVIFTATGEKVRQMHFGAGGTGGQAGVNGGVFWDGRNGEGMAVLNGVYVAVIKVAEGDLTAKVKIAVVK